MQRLLGIGVKGTRLDAIDAFNHMYIWKGCGASAFGRRVVVPNMKRVSSGRSEFCNNLTQNLTQRSEFKDVLYLEGHHTERQSIEHYIGLWESVNDIRVQAGEAKFAQFISFIQESTQFLDHIDAEYLTRAWLARKA